MVKNLSAIAGDTGLMPGQGRSYMPWGHRAHEPQLLSLSAATPEAHVPRACALQQHRPLHCKLLRVLLCLDVGGSGG